MKNNKIVDKNRLMMDKVKKNMVKNPMSIRKKSLTRMMMQLRKNNKKDKMTKSQKKRKSLLNLKEEEIRLT